VESVFELEGCVGIGTNGVIVSFRDAIKNRSSWQLTINNCPLVAKFSLSSMHNLGSFGCPKMEFFAAKARNHPKIDIFPNSKVGGCIDILFEASSFDNFRLLMRERHARITSKADGARLKNKNAACS
jgi:hypothetical protein